MPIEDDSIPPDLPGPSDPGSMSTPEYQVTGFSTAMSGPPAEFSSAGPSSSSPSFGWPPLPNTTWSHEVESSSSSSQSQPLPQLPLLELPDPVPCFASASKKSGTESPVSNSKDGSLPAAGSRPGTCEEPTTTERNIALGAYISRPEVRKVTRTLRKARKAAKRKLSASKAAPSTPVPTVPTKKAKKELRRQEAVSRVRRRQQLDLFSSLEPNDASLDHLHPCLFRLKGSKEEKRDLAEWLNNPDVLRHIVLRKNTTNRDRLAALVHKKVKCNYNLHWAEAERTREAGEEKLLEVSIFVSDIKVGAARASNEGAAIDAAAGKVTRFFFDKREETFSGYWRKQRTYDYKAAIMMYHEQLELSNNTASDLEIIKNFRNAIAETLTKSPFKDFSGSEVVRLLVNERNPARPVLKDFKKLKSCVFLLETLSGISEASWLVFEEYDRVCLRVPGFDFLVRSDRGAAVTDETKEKLAHGAMCVKYPHFKSWRHCVFEVIDIMQGKLEEEMVADGVPPLQKFASLAIGAMSPKLAEKADD